MNINFTLRINTMFKRRFFCIDAHTCGNPVRLVASGVPLLDGNNMAEKRAHFVREFDWIRKSLMFEPRGHDMMSGSMLFPPHDPSNDAAVLFIETSGCLPMCGHGTIGTITIAIEEGLIIPKIRGKVRMETPSTRGHQPAKLINLIILKLAHFYGRLGVKLFKPELNIFPAFGMRFDKRPVFPSILYDYGDHGLYEERISARSYGKMNIS